MMAGMPRYYMYLSSSAIESCGIYCAQVGSVVISHRQPEPYEARIQAMSVVAACAKGLMYFQSEVRNN